MSKLKKMSEQIKSIIRSGFSLKYQINESSSDKELIKEEYIPA